MQIQTNPSKVLALVFALSVCFSSIEGQQQSLLSIDLWSSQADFLSGGKIKFVQGATTRYMFTDSEGTSQLYNFVPGQAFSVDVKEKATTTGFRLGVSAALYMADVGQYDLEVYRLNFSQPVLERVLVQSGHAFPIMPKEHKRWAIAANGSGVDFAGHVGLLVNAMAIDDVEDYYGVDFGSTAYAFAFVLHATSAVELGDGIALDVSCQGYAGISGMPNVDAFYIAPNAASLGGMALNITSLGWEFANAFGASYLLEGSLGKGINVLLFGGGASGVSNAQVESVPTFLPGYTAGVPWSSAAAAPNCDPVVPHEPCNVDPPDDHENCADSGCNPAPVCTYSEKAYGDAPVCSDGITPVPPITAGTSGQWHVGFEVKGKVGEGGGVEMGPEVGYTSGADPAATMQPGPGKCGKGECLQLKKLKTQCKKTCTVHDWELAVLLFAFACFDDEQTTKCVNEAIMMGHCNKGVDPNGNCL